MQHVACDVRRVILAAECICMHTGKYFFLLTFKHNTSMPTPTLIEAARHYRTLLWFPLAVSLIIASRGACLTQIFHFPIKLFSIRRVLHSNGGILHARVQLILLLSKYNSIWTSQTLAWFQIPDSTSIWRGWRMGTGRQNQ